MSDDPSRAYDCGALAASLQSADDAIGRAFGSALRLEGYDAELTQAVLAAQAAIKRARSRELTPDWKASD